MVEHANPLDAGGHPVEGGKDTIHLYDKAGRKKLEKVSLAIFNKTAGTTKKPSEFELAEDRADLADEMHNNPSGERAKELMQKIVVADGS
jgi:hypothetical protein